VDRYELVALLGEGGMAQVWAARQEGKHGFKKLFALKAIHQRLADEPQFHRMFLDEARIASEIEHPNVAQVFDLGESGSMLYLVMEYVDGESLAALLSGIARKTGERAKVPVGNALRMVADVCAGLNAAHKLTASNGKLRGVVHRDVSPQNVLISVKGDVKLIDFGIAHASDRVAADTGVDSLKGKLRYMAPEQARREALGPFTDVWAAGALLYRLLAGHSPYEAPNELETMQLLLSGAAPSPLPEGTPALVSAIVERAMSTDPGDRYASAAEMQTALEAAIGEEGLVPDVATWVRTNLTERYQKRREALATRDALPASGGTASVPLDKTMPSALAPFAKNASNAAANAPANLPEVPSLDVPDEPPRVPPPSSVESSDIHITLQSARPPAAKPPPAKAASAPVAADPTPAPAARPGETEIADNEPERPPTPIEVKITRATIGGGPTDAEAQGDDTDAPRSFMDVGAIAAKRSAEASARGDGDAAGGASPTPKRMPRSTKSAAQQKREEEEERELLRRKRMIAIGAVTGVLVVGVGIVIALPTIVRGRILAAAQAAGVDLTVSDVSVAFSGVTVRGATAKAGSLPGVEVSIAEIHATGLSASDVSLAGVDVKVAGDADALATSALQFYNAHRRELSPPNGTPSRRVTIAGIHLLWSEPFGPGSRIDAGDVGLEIVSRAVGSEELKGVAGRFEVKTPKTTFGPWSGTFERSTQSTRVRVAFDPPLPDGPNAVYMWGPGTKPHLAIHIPRVPFSQIGVKPQEVGIPADDKSEVDLVVEGGVTPTQRVEGDLKLTLYRAHLLGWKHPVDLKVEASVNGEPGKPLVITHSAVNVGPFAGYLLGTVTPHDHALRLDAAWKTLPIPCEQLAKGEAAKFGPFAATLQELGQSTGAIRVTGNARAAGQVSLDTASLEAATVTFQTRESCGVSLFGLP
jgi:serine/threonine protein kinase